MLWQTQIAETELTRTKWEGKNWTNSRVFDNNYNDNVVIVVCDLDDRDKASFLSELNTVSESCHNQPQVRFCLAIEEGEAWLLGDWNAIKKAYPKAKEKVFSKYQNDSICGTWEKLADIVYAGGSSKLKKQGYAVVGQTKVNDP